jgi:preprotein translocase subunit SecY
MWQQQNLPENLQKQGAFIPGYSPGEATSSYLQVPQIPSLAQPFFLMIDK